ncbi:MAG: hypothetical protein J5449_02115 [Oscillospiraceae bacterium]|nr:hypothetical protein [Oscillospiraceae bacterium]
MEYHVHMKERPDMSRNVALAGKTVSSKGVNVTYDEYGYAVCITNYKHSSFEGTMNGIRAPSIDAVLSNGNRGRYIASAEDLAHFSDDELASLEELRWQVRDGEVTANEAYAYLESLRRTYGYSGDGSNEFLALEPQNPGASYAADTASQVARVMISQASEQSGMADAEAPQTIVQSDGAAQTVLEAIPPQVELSQVAAQPAGEAQTVVQASAADDVPRVIAQNEPDNMPPQVILQQSDVGSAAPQTIVQTAQEAEPAQIIAQSEPDTESAQVIVQSSISASSRSEKGDDSRNEAPSANSPAFAASEDKRRMQQSYQERLRLQQDIQMIRTELNEQRELDLLNAYGEQVKAGLLGAVLDDDE